MNRFTGKIVVVIGGYDGIGGAIAERFAVEGGTVFTTSRRAVEEDRTHGAGQLRARRVDALDITAIQGFFETVQHEAGRIDGLVISAGLADYATLDMVDADHFDRAFGLNVRALVFAAKAASAMMPEGGSVVLVGSIAGEIGTKGYGVYGATKAAVRALARTWANELAPRGIRVNVVAPGPTDTAMMSAASEDIRASLQQVIPLSRLGRPEEIAAAALFLASEDASFITGVELPVDGGMAQV
ncbi:SDR family NAD(P)-dependent oxidoreductase [Novosphingobium sp.]|uniref:SDR family NAD(P)-dependent oxidoreductase n=1 Tax=Novosphingobium sp. TaxID=1874826 RepID=UPI002FDE64DD